MSIIVLKTSVFTERDKDSHKEHESSHKKAQNMKNGLVSFLCVLCTKCFYEAG